jgi:hypothetical protein
MTANAAATSKPIIFFSARNLGEELHSKVEEIDPQFTSPAEEKIFLEAVPAFTRHMKNNLFDFGGLHLGVFEFGAGLPVALHTHKGDCAYYVERGSIIMGNKEIKAGEGFLVPDGQPYGYVVGPEGLRLIEFSQTPRNDITFLERSMENWAKRVDKAVRKLETA